MRNPELQRIQNDLARAKQRVAEIESGQRGVRPAADWRQDTDGGNPGHALAYSAQLQAQRDAIVRLELELVQAFIASGTYQPAEILERMSLPRVPVDRPANNADVMAKVREIISHLPDTATIQSLKELIT